MEPQHRHACRLFGWLVTALWLALAIHPAFAADATPPADAGVLHGAAYRIDIPADWNGDLVMLMQGYKPVGVPETTPMTPSVETDIFLKRGYAVAQSAYATQGWAVGDAIVDSERLRQHFIDRFGAPRHAYMVGFSLGGLETAASIERFPQAYDGALVMCGVTVSTPDVLARGVLEPLVTFDALIPDVLPDLAAPDAPPYIGQDVFEAALKAHPAEAALLGGRMEHTAEGTAGPLSLYYMVLREFEQRAGGMPVDNRETVYEGFGDDDAFNRKVHRYAGDPDAMDYARDNVTLTGRIAVPLVMQWNVVDPTIPSRFHPLYPEQVRAAGNGKWLTVLQPVGEEHCAFSDEQIDMAFGILVSGVTGD